MRTLTIVLIFVLVAILIVGVVLAQSSLHLHFIRYVLRHILSVRLQQS